VVLLDPGRDRFSALGVTSDDVSMKNINSRKIISVSDDILNSALTLLLFFTPMVLAFISSKEL